jgi:c-di-GMP-binding flagellar brake protein YcgR
MKKYDEQFTNPQRIIRLLETCFLEEERLELQVNGRVRIFFSYLVDHIPDQQRQLNNQGQFIYVDPPYTPLSFLQQKSYILISPMVPTEGNIQVGASQFVALRFFNGMHAVEAHVKFLEYAEVRKEPAIKLSFPEQMGIIRTRRHFRAKAVDDSQIVVMIFSTDIPTITTRIMDISVGGLAFYSPVPPDMLPRDHVINLTIQLPDDAPLSMDAFVRRHEPVPGAPKEQSQLNPQESICGVQFDIADRALELRVSDLVGRIQREYLQRLRERRTQCNITSKMQFLDPERLAPLGDMADDLLDFSSSLDDTPIEAMGDEEALSDLISMDDGFGDEDYDVEEEDAAEVEPYVPQSATPPPMPHRSDKPAAAAPRVRAAEPSSGAFSSNAGGGAVSTKRIEQLQNRLEQLEHERLERSVAAGHHRPTKETGSWFKRLLGGGSVAHASSGTKPQAQTTEEKPQTPRGRKAELNRLLEMKKRKKLF